MKTHDDAIHEAVRDRYGDIARQFSPQGNAASCCSPGDAAQSCCAPALYDAALLSDLPADVTGLSLGCGDPVTLAGLQPGEVVLDLGSGGGIDCFLAARQVGESGHVIGVDLTPDMIAKADANKAKLGAQNVEFRLGQIEALPVEDNSIDVILSNCVVNLSPDKSAVFHEAFRVLRPGGRLSISDIVTEGEFSPAWRSRLDAWAACVSGAIDAQEVVALMREAGFVDVQVADKEGIAQMLTGRAGLPRIYSARITGYKPA